MDSSGDWLFVTNSNADLRYNDGTLVALSLERAAKDREPYDPGDNPPATENHPDWAELPGGQLRRPAFDSQYPIDFCCWDALDPNARQLRRARLRRPRPSTRATGRGTCASAASRPGWCGRSRRARVEPKTTGRSGQRVACETCADYRRQRRRSPADRRARRHVADVRRRRVRGAPTTPPRLKCVGCSTAPDAPGGFVTCDDDHRVIKPRSATRGGRSDRCPTMPPDVPLARRAVRAGDRRRRRAAVHRPPERQHHAPVHGRLLAVRRRAAAIGRRDRSDAPRFIAPFPSPFSANSVGSVGVTALKRARQPTDDACLRDVALRAAGRGTGRRPRVCPVRRHDRSARSPRSRTATTTTRRSRAPRRAGSSSSTECASAAVAVRRCSGRRPR